MKKCIVKENRYIGEVTVSHEQPINQKVIIDQNIFLHSINLRGSVSLILTYTLYRKKIMLLRNTANEILKQNIPSFSPVKWLVAHIKRAKKNPITILIALCYSALVIKYISHTIKALSPD